jgi:DNA-binding response OmpR family regulator
MAAAVLNAFMGIFGLPTAIAMKPTKARILLVEDDSCLATGLQTCFETLGYLVDLATDGKSGLRSAAVYKPELVLLDLMLPDMHGFDVLYNLRTHFPVLPVIILSARMAEADHVSAFRRGADDYVTKPFSIAELELRIQRFIDARSATRAELANGNSLGEIVLDRARRILRRGSEEVRLTLKEFDLLSMLMVNAGSVVTRQDLLRSVWNYPPDITTRTLDQHIARLRHKIEINPRMPQRIVTVPRGGFVFIK